jgi:hypothetical protein
VEGVAIALIAVFLIHLELHTLTTFGDQQVEIRSWLLAALSALVRKRGLVTV